jgi:hypothetical protein
MQARPKRATTAEALRCLLLLLLLDSGSATSFFDRVRAGLSRLGATAAAPERTARRSPRPHNGSLHVLHTQLAAKLREADELRALISDLEASAAAHHHGPRPPRLNATREVGHHTSRNASHGALRHERLTGAESPCSPREWNIDTAPRLPATEVCLRWLHNQNVRPAMATVYGGTPLWPDVRTPIPYLSAVVMRPLRPSTRSGHAAAAGAILIIYGACGSSSYGLDVTRVNLGLIRRHQPRALVLMVTCGEGLWPDDVLGLADGVLRARCASALGYDAGLWQQGVRYALTALEWPRLGGVWLINDSVLGPLYPFELGPGLTAAAVWEHHVVSAAMTGYSRAVATSPAFVRFWNESELYCNKVGSMLLVEGGLAQRFRSVPCDTYSNDIHSFQEPPVGPLGHSKPGHSLATRPPLPFYKHKNGPTLQRNHAARGRAALDEFVHRVAAARERTPGAGRKTACQVLSSRGRRAAAVPVDEERFAITTASRRELAHVSV